MRVGLSCLVVCLLAPRTLAAIEVTHVETGQAAIFDVPPSVSSSSLTFSVAVSRRFGIRRFQLTSPDHTSWTEALSAGTGKLHLHPANESSPAACVDPFWACERTNLPQQRGIAANWFYPKALQGNTHPGASLPHGMVSVVAFSGAYPTGYGTTGYASAGQPSAAISGDYSDKHADIANSPFQYSTTGFSHFQPSGTGSIGNYMNFARVMPLASAPGDFMSAGAPWLDARRDTLVGERAEPGRYAAHLGREGVAAEVTTGPGVALHRYAFGAAEDRSVVVELSAAGLPLIPRKKQLCQGLDVSIQGSVVRGTIHTPPPAGTRRGVGLPLFFHMDLGVNVSGFWPAELGATNISLDASAMEAHGGHIGVVAAATPLTEVRVGFSLRDLATATANLKDVSNFTFDEVADGAWREWNDALARISVEDVADTPGAMRERNLFYSVLFHALRKPADFTGQVPDEWIAGASGDGYVFDLATMFDQHKTTLPLILSVYPTMGQRLLNGLLALARRFGEFPIGYTMDNSFKKFDNQAQGLGHHTLADGFYRNITLDWKAALGLMAKTFTETEEGLQFVEHGVTPPLLTHTLDLSVAAYATMQIATAVGDKDLEKNMSKLVHNWRNAYNETTCLLRNSSDAQYYEGTYMNYGFRMLPDMAARIGLCGDSSNFVELMDAFFGYGRAPAVQLPIVPWQGHRPAWVGQLSDSGYNSHTYEGLCNEPDMETPYSYAYAGRADRVQEVVTAVKSYSFAPGRGGLAGNDDSGGEAAWYVWSSIGIFPVTGQPVYIIGSPSFASLSVHLGDSVLRIRRQGAGAYIQSGTLNGKDLEGRAWLAVAEAHRGGELVLSMGPKPSSSWGASLPPSISHPAAREPPQLVI